MAATTDAEECPGCRAAPGTAHQDECDHAWCPDCGEQLFLHMCDHWDDDADGPDRPALWHGVDQRAQVARQHSWWTTAVGIDHLVEDYTRVLFAIGLGQITWEPTSQTYAIGQIDESALDRAIADSRPGASSLNRKWTNASCAAPPAATRTATTPAAKPTTLTTTRSNQPMPDIWNGKPLPERRTTQTTIHYRLYNAITGEVVGINTTNSLAVVVDDVIRTQQQHPDARIDVVEYDGPAWRD